MVFTDIGTVMEKHAYFVSTSMNNLRFVINTLANHLVLKLNSGLSSPNIMLGCGTLPVLKREGIDLSRDV